MRWEAWVLIVLLLSSVPVSVTAVGKVRTSFDMTVNVITCIAMAWLVLRLDGVL